MPTQPPRLLLHLARVMRERPTAAERIAWEIVRDRRCLGLRIKRQVVIEGMIVDFYCRELHLAIELDGGVHRTPEGRERDRARDAHLCAHGVRVLHVRNEDATGAHLTALLTDIHRRSPSPLAGEGDRG